MRISSKVAYWEAESGFQPSSLCHLRCLTGQPPTRVRPATANASAPLPTEWVWSLTLCIPGSPPSRGPALPLDWPLSRPTLILNLKTTSILPLRPGLSFSGPAPARSSGSRLSAPTPYTQPVPLLSLGLPAPPLPLKPRPSRPRPRTAPFSLAATRALSRSI